MFVIPLILPLGIIFQRQHIFLSLIIPGYPGDNMSVYMEPLIDDLLRAWEDGGPDIRSSYKDKLQNACVVHVLLA